MHEPIANGTEPGRDDWLSRRHVQGLALLLATGGGIYVCYRLTLPFLPALAWALTLAVLFLPCQLRLEARLKSVGTAAAVSVLLAALVVAAPATFVAQQLLTEAARGADLVRKKVESGEWRRAIEAQPRVAPAADWIERNINLSGTARDVSEGMASAAGSFVKGSVRYAVGFCLTFYLLFYFLRDRAQALHAVRSLSLLSAPEMDRLLVRVADTIHATIYGTLAVAVVQGVLGGLMFWWLGLPAPLLWGAVMALLAAVPVFGAFVIWIPAALFLALEGSWAKALILALWGAVVVGGIDNVLQPVLIGNRLKLHTILAFISVVGGLLLFGASGLIVGPVVLTVTMVLLEIWRQRITPAGTGARPETSPAILAADSRAAVAPATSATAERPHTTAA